MEEDVFNRLIGEAGNDRKIVLKFKRGDELQVPPDDIKSVHSTHIEVKEDGHTRLIFFSDLADASVI